MHGHRNLKFTDVLLDIRSYVLIKLMGGIILKLNLKIEWDGMGMIYLS